MSNKSSVVIFVVVALVIIGGITFAFNSKGSTPVVQPVVETPSTSTPTPTTTVPVVTTPAPSTYTMAQVATHSTRTNCWTTISGGVYNVTSWIDQHPGEHRLYSDSVAKMERLHSPISTEESAALQMSLPASR